MWYFIVVTLLLNIIFYGSFLFAIKEDTEQGVSGAKETFWVFIGLALLNIIALLLV